MCHEKSPLDEVKKNKTIKKVKMPKISTDNPFFKNRQIHKKFVLEKWLKHPHISINQKNLQNIGLKGNIN